MLPRDANEENYRAVLCTQTFPEDGLFENEQTAHYVLERFLNLNDQMTQTIIAIQSQTSPEELRAFKKACGNLILEVFDRVVEPICKRHPSLTPPGMIDGK